MSVTGVNERLAAVTAAGTSVNPAIFEKAILGYLPSSDATDAAVARFRARLIAEHGVATTFGYGPRYLHSTGRLHKGGPPVGPFVEVVDDPQADLPVPGEPYTFAQLIRAQADGDLQTLRAHGLDAVRVSKEVI